MIEELVSRVFSTRNAVHLSHWSTNSFAEHKTLSLFYDNTIEGINALIDDLTNEYLTTYYKLTNLS